MSGTNIEDLIEPGISGDISSVENIHTELICLLDAMDALLKEVRERIDAVKR